MPRSRCHCNYQKRNTAFALSLTSPAKQVKAIGRPDKHEDLESWRTMVTAEHRVVVLRRIADLQSEVEMLRRTQDRLRNMARLQFCLGVHGIEVLDCEGAALYDLGRVVQCEICGDLVGEDELGYEILLRSRAFGSRRGYLHRDCFDRTVREGGL